MSAESQTYNGQADSQGLREDLDAIDEVRTLLGSMCPDVHLPGIVVVGNQSSGKSSVLESISRVPLPRGDGTVTRCPVELQIREAAHFQATVQGAANLTGSAAVAEAIQSAMDKVVGSTAISNEPVKVSIRQPGGPNLTLTDLPGLIALLNPNKAFIEDMVTSYLRGDGISGPCGLLADQHGDDTFYEADESAAHRNVIVCVLEAAIDWESQAAISYATQHDPTGQRTLFVVTKVDLAVPGLRRRLDKLQREHLMSQSKLGYVLVRNRTREEVKQNMSAEDALQKEQDFFNGISSELTAQQLAVSEELRSLTKERKGTAELIKKLVHIQQVELRAGMPAVRRQIDLKIMAGENTLVSMPRCPQDESSAQHELWIRLDAAIRKFTALNAGEYGDMNRADKKVEARLREINTGLQGKIWEEIGGSHGEGVFAEEIFAKKVKDAFVDVAEPLPFMKDGFKVLEVLYQKEVYAHVINPCRELLREVRIYLGDVWQYVIDDIFEVFPRLKDAVWEQVECHLDNRKAVAMAFIETLVKHSKSVFTVNPKYTRAAGKGKTDIQRHAFCMELKQALQARTQASSSLTPSAAGQTAVRPTAAGTASARATTAEPVDHSESFTTPTWWDYVNEDQPAVWALADKLACGSVLPEKERDVIECQFLLVNFARVVVDRISDEVPLAVRAILVDEVLGGDLATPDTSLAAVVTKYFREASSVLGLVQDEAIMRERVRLQNRLTALKAAKRRLAA